MISENGVNVAITPEGRVACKSALPQLSMNVKRYFIDQLTAQDKTSIKRVMGKIKKMAE